MFMGIFLNLKLTKKLQKQQLVFSKVFAKQKISKIENKNILKRT